MKDGSRAALGAAAVGLLVLASGVARAEQCSVFDAGTGESVDGKCTVAYDGGSDTITIGKKKVVFVQKDRQGQWAAGTLDGKPAMRYEINRVTYSYATQDLTLFLDLTSE